MTKIEYKIEDLIKDSSVEIIEIADITAEKVKTDLEKDTCILEKQVFFYRDCTKLILSELNVEKPILIPAKCGFGKSTYIKSLIETLIDNVNKNKIEEDNLYMIVTANRIEDLKILKESIESIHGQYDNQFPYIALSQSWNKDINCLDTENPVLNYEESLNKCNKGCSFYNNKECSLGKQFEDMKNSPILAITNEKLNIISRQNKIEDYQHFSNKTKKRKLLLIDEKPKISNNSSISIKEVNNLKNILLRYIPNRNKNSTYNQKKLILLEKLDSIEKLLISYIKEYDKYDNFFILPEKIDFLDEWREVFGYKYEKEISNIKMIFQSGIVWNKYSNNFYLAEDVAFSRGDLKTFIFDGTANMTLEYNDKEFNSIKMDDYKDYNHLTFHIIDKSISKSKIKEDPKKLDIICDWINSTFDDKSFVISYKEALGVKVSEELTKNLKNNENIILDNGHVPYFGNTKGKNLWSKCNNMLQIGWYTFDSGTYIAKYLSLNPDEKQKLINMKEKPDELYSKLKITNGNFDDIDINIHKTFDMFVNFEQEVYRTNIREFSSSEDVNVYIFTPNDNFLKDLLEVRFHNCKVKNYKIKDFEKYNETKYINASGKENIKKFIEWLDKKLKNNELKGKQRGISTEFIDKELGIKLNWKYHIGVKKEFYKLLTARRVKIDTNKQGILEVYKY